MEEKWKRILSIIKDSVSESDFAAWFNTIIPLRESDGEILLGVPDEYVKQKIEKDYGSMLSGVVESVFGRGYRIEYVIVPVSTQETAIGKENNGNKYRSKLNPKYTFSTFVIGNSNKLAHAASVAVAESPGTRYNPLFIYGGVGLGKTHLMQAIGHYILQRDSSTNVAYVSSEQFTNELIDSIRDDKTSLFRKKYRNIDILLIDDIQFLAGKEGTQEEFFHTFNTLYENNKQIVISSDRPPKEIPTLQDRLVSRFEWGLIVDIQPPDLETRVAILRKKRETEGYDVPDEVIEFIAKSINSNIRELEGALIRVIAQQSLSGKKITVEDTARILKDIIPVKEKRIDVRTIKEAVATVFKISVEDLRISKRTKEIAFPRQIAMYLARKYTTLPLTQIALEFGKKDHTTVLHAEKKIKELIGNSEEIREKIEQISRLIHK